MPKVLNASCTGGIVVAEGVPVSATVLSEGVGSSTGILILDQESSIYLAKITPDLKLTLEKLSLALGSIVSALSLIDTKIMVTAGPSGPGTAGPTPTATSDIVSIGVAKTQIDALKELLK